MNEETLQNLSEELEEVKRKMQERDRIKRHIEQLRSELSEEKTRKSRHYKTLKNAEEEIEELEGMSLHRFFHSLFGDPKQEIKERKQQLAEAKTAYESAKSAIEEMNRERDELKQRLEELNNLEGRYEEVLNKKAEALKQMDHPRTEELQTLSEQIGELRNQLDEVEEAISAGDLLVSHIRRIRSVLRDAQSLGRHDMVWGGIFVTMAKRGKMSTAEKLNRQARKYARKFKRELDDLEQISASHGSLTGMSSLGGMSDYFLDGIFDIFAQQKINSGLSTIQRRAGRLREKLGKLKAKRDEIENNIQRKQDERKQIIKEA